MEVHYRCNFCDNIYENEEELRKHIRQHIEDDDQQILPKGIEVDKALKGALKVHS